MPENDYEAPRSNNIRGERAGDGLRITDIDIPFGRLIIIILKWMLASIPAAILMWIIMFVIMMVLGSIIGINMNGF